MHTLSRADRRSLKSGAVKTAQLAVSRGFVLEDTDGGVAKLKDPEAQKLLKQAIVRSLRNGGEPVVTQLTETQAARFPHSQGEDGLCPWLGVALSKDGRVAIITLRLAVEGAGDCAEAERSIRDRVMVELVALSVTRDVHGLFSVARSV